MVRVEAPHGDALGNVQRHGNLMPSPEGLAERRRGEATGSPPKYTGEAQVGVAPGPPDAVRDGGKGRRPCIRSPVWMGVPALHGGQLPHGPSPPVAYRPARGVQLLP